MDEPRTCGQGLAEHSALPAKVGELIASVADNLELHTKALDATDKNARRELDAYVKLAAEHRRLAEHLTAVADRMAAYRDLPMGRHDEAAMSESGVSEAFERFVAGERELLALLQGWVERDERMLAQMREATQASGMQSRR